MYRQIHIPQLKVKFHHTDCNNTLRRGKLCTELGARDSLLPSSCIRHHLLERLPAMLSKYACFSVRFPIC
jgi:hypothetical protein